MSACAARAWAARQPRRAGELCKHSQAPHARPARCRHAAGRGARRPQRPAAANRRECTRAPPPPSLPPPWRTPPCPSTPTPTSASRATTGGGGGEWGGGMRAGVGTRAAHARRPTLPSVEEDKTLESVLAEFWSAPDRWAERSGAGGTRAPPRRLARPHPLSTPASTVSRTASSPAPGPTSSAAWRCWRWEGERKGGAGGRRSARPTYPPTSPPSNSSG